MIGGIKLQKIDIDKNVYDILNKIESTKHEAYLVGGYVRDFLLQIDKLTIDYDICTSCPPHLVIELFSDEKIILTGLKHGTVMVVINKTVYEITTFRKDMEYNDYRKPERIQFTGKILDDLNRRDFTINTFLANKEGEIISLIPSSVDDLNNKIIRTVGDPRKRFTEDALRMLRAIRFACELNFEIDGKTLDAIKENSYLIKYISIERIRDQFNLMMLSNNPERAIRLLQSTNLLKEFLPEVEACVGFDQHSKYHHLDVFEHTLLTLSSVKDNDLIIRLAALFHDIGKPLVFTMDEEGNGHFYEHAEKSKELTLKIMKRLKYSNKMIIDVSSIVSQHMKRFDVDDKKLKRIMECIDEESIRKLFILQEADIVAHKPPHDFSKLEQIKELYEKLLVADLPFRITDLEVNGNDLIKLGVVNKEIGVILSEIQKEIIYGSLENNKPQIIEYIKGKMED